jgi:guanyl-specific ribonuclease Sa
LEEEGGINLYEFATSSPLNWIDPFGLCDTARGALLDELGETETQKRGKQWANNFTATAEAIANQLPPVQAYTAVSGKDAMGNDVGLLGQGLAIASVVPAERAVGWLGKLLRPVKRLVGLEKKAIPQKALSTLKHIREKGQAPPGYVGGRTFKNAEGRLPSGGKYREYDVDPKPVTGNRNAERLVVDESSGRAWYTDDHYGSFSECK